MAKIFVSSVMTGFEMERKSAERTIRSLRHEPVMAETFGAQSRSPEQACAEGVKSADWYLAILGSRYGNVQASGISATEEEFRLAKKLNKKIAVLVHDSTMEPRQSEFVTSIGGYSSGWLYARYKDILDLQNEINRAVTNLEEDSVASATEHDSRLRDEFKQERLHRDGKVRLAIAATPLNQREWIELAEFGGADFKEGLQKEAMFGTGRIFSSTSSTGQKDGRESLTIFQEARWQEAHSYVAAYLDGTLFVSLPVESISNDPSARYSLSHLYLIDELLLTSRLTAVTRFAGAFYSNVLRDSPPRVAVAIAIWNIANKRLSQRGHLQIDSISVPTNQFETPLVVPRKVCVTTPRDLVEDGITKQLCAHIAQAFKASDAYVQ